MMNLVDYIFFRFEIVGGGNATGYATGTFVEQGMADGRLSIVSKEEKAKKVVLVGGGYISMEIVATLRMVKSGVYVNVLCM
uniref:Uncharacterized protein n=1 Tax=Cucumis melo subsp. melo TaxID=412675 RepID=E5GB76_CUCME|nr:hypothetical protein [Cucumis melo subsp. melo]